MPTTPVPPLRPLVIGHRGASADAPENTIAAFELALEQGADGIELGVHLSSDGHP
ncbi:MAG TPA: glycerophosphodiester phosphodiesterase family protein, partial [Methylomirabilota bacterium]|nr:glycerophosphodiester phosphodiesterase family protein [Methylomirabilota bacterium]